MIANYGYQDGSGEYYHHHRHRLLHRVRRPVVRRRVSAALFVIEADDYDDEVATIVETGAQATEGAVRGLQAGDGARRASPARLPARPAAISHSW